MAAHARLKIKFTEGDKYQNLMSRLNLFDKFQTVSLTSISHNCIGFTLTDELRHEKTNKRSVRPAKTQISLGIRPA